MQCEVIQNLTIIYMLVFVSRLSSRNCCMTRHDADLTCLDKQAVSFFWCVLKIEAVGTGRIHYSKINRVRSKFYTHLL